MNVHLRPTVLLFRGQEAKLSGPLGLGGQSNMPRLLLESDAAPCHVIAPDIVVGGGPNELDLLRVAAKVDNRAAELIYATGSLELIIDVDEPIQTNS
ncbi:MAG TPA: hypothetical protein VFE33_31155 [Thermoanaerobaculia bacterium]|nr:hypothetical protein [Thermoanaerobaculia bacterium]